jgi:hypothetical protein
LLALILRLFRIPVKPGLQRDLKSGRELGRDGNGLQQTQQVGMYIEFLADKTKMLPATILA